MFVKMAVYKIKEANKAMSGGGGFHISKLMRDNGRLNV